MPRPLDGYEHMNKDGCMEFSLNVDVLADQIVAMNYGTIRFIAALARARRRSEKIQAAITVAPEGKDELADMLEAMVRNGLF